MQNATRIYALSKRNIILRYKSSLIGFFWGFIKPLLYLLIFIVIFSSQFNSINNYILYATSGLIFWFFFSNVTNQSIANIVGSSGILKSLSVPPIFFPLSDMISELFNLVLTLFVFMILMHWFGIVYSFNLLLILPSVLLFGIFSMGITLILSSLNVFFRDIGIVWGTVQPAIFYLTPIAYPESLIPPHYKFIIKCNPIYYFIKLSRDVMYESKVPPARLWLLCAAMAGFMYIVGLLVFNKLKNQFISAI
jgi:ABC-2 type transport system permease protein